MSTRFIATPTSRVHFGLARVEITPPVGIYHRVWGAAKHERATGVHRALYADVMAFAPGYIRKKWPAWVQGAWKGSSRPSANGSQNCSDGPGIAILFWQLY